MFTGETCSFVPEAVDCVNIDGFFESSKRDGGSGSQKSGVWHSTDLFGMEIATLDLTAVAYDEGALEVDDAVTSLLAST